MRVTVFGATGGIGRHVVRRLLDREDQVTAFVRDPAKLDQLGLAYADHPGVDVVRGELDDAAAIAGVIRGRDAVISALGPSLARGARGTPATEGARNLLPR